MTPKTSAPVSSEDLEWYETYLWSTWHTPFPKLMAKTYSPPPRIFGGLVANEITTQRCRIQAGKFAIMPEPEASQNGYNYTIEAIDLHWSGYGWHSDWRPWTFNIRVRDEYQAIADRSIGNT